MIIFYGKLIDGLVHVIIKIIGQNLISDSDRYFMVTGASTFFSTF